jgi:acetylornithine deacetylase
VTRAPAAGAAERVRAYFAAARPELVATLAELVAVPSLPGSLRQNDCQAILADLLGARATIDRWVPDWDAVRAMKSADDEPLYLPIEERDAAYGEILPSLEVLVASVDAGSAGPHLILNGHIDVAGVEPEDAWSTPPFDPVVDGDRMYGRGTMDMKAGVVAAAFALRAIADLELADAGLVSFASVPEEESGGNGTLAALARGHVGDAVVFTEPTGLQVVHRHLGIQEFAIRLTGRAGGMLKRSWGDSAAVAMAQVVVALDALEAARSRRAKLAGGYDEDDEPGFINVGRLEAGEWLATRAGSATARGLMGVLPGERPADALAELEHALSAIEWTRDWFERHGPALEAPAPGHAGGELAADDDLVTAFTSAGRALGHPGIRPSRAGAMVCDAKVVHGGGFAPALVFGPEGTGLHCPDESVVLGSVLTCAEVLTLGVSQLLATRT